MDNQNINIAKMLENAAKQIRDGKYGNLTLNDSIIVTSATNYLKVDVKLNSVERTKPTNKTTTFFGNWLKPK